jgi:dipeptidyl aminopeptidase/acylaminoacyl peptidase
MNTISKEHVKFIWSSEMMNGYRHLFLVEKYKHSKESTIKQLTRGDWCCIDKSIYVDEKRNLVYFSAKKETPLETHFYVLNYSLEKEEEPILLTKLGYSHIITMNSPNYFIDSFSTLHDPQCVLIQKMDHHSRSLTIEKSALISPITLLKKVQEEQQEEEAITPSTQKQQHLSPPYSTPNGEIFSFTTSDGLILYGCLYKPKYYKSDKSYPTILHIYGGPKTQLVMNEFKFPRLMRYLMSVYFGFAVVIIDSRGSTDRGLNFESKIKYNLGLVELKDQIQGLLYLNQSKFGCPTHTTSVIDLSRIAITGWSYGGYLSLMAISQYSNIFKMAIAGAPVTQWELYDAAYTERYMGLPTDHSNEYYNSNVLSHINKFPDR